MCTRCYDDYELINNICERKCNGNCKTCNINNIDECTSCYPNYVLDEKKNCISCSEMEAIGGKGCKNCEYLQLEEKNICKECEKDYIYIENKQICVSREKTGLSEYCNVANQENNDLYSCIECRNSENYILVKKYNNMYNCYIRKDGLENCEGAFEDENGKLSCEKCLYKMQLIWNEKYKKDICKCSSEQFLYIRGDEKRCYQCDDKDKGKPGCVHCEYFPANDELDCEECGSGYFNFKKQCISCIEGTHNCELCHFDNILNRFICTTCKSNNKLEGNKCKKVCNDNENCEEEPKNGFRIDWKDIYRFELNSHKENNYEGFEGVNNEYELQYNLVGITRSHIKTRHELLIILTFRINYSNNLRNLEEEKLEVPTECIPLSTKNETNEFEIIEYECKGKITNENNLTLNNIKLEDIQQNKTDDDEFIINSSLEELIYEKNIDELTNETPTFNLENLKEIIIFKSDNIGNITFENNIFDFSLNGNINKDINPTIINGSLKLNEIKDRNADCELDIKENQNAQLNCSLNLENSEVSILWKELYRLLLNSNKENNYEAFEKYNELYVSFNLVGITKSQIKTRHELLIILTFRINYSNN